MLNWSYLREQDTMCSVNKKSSNVNKFLILFVTPYSQGLRYCKLLINCTSKRKKFDDESTRMQ